MILNEWTNFIFYIGIFIILIISFIVNKIPWLKWNCILGLKHNFTFLEKSQEVDFLGKKTGESFNIYRCEDCHTEKSEIIS